MKKIYLLVLGLFLVGNIVFVFAEKPSDTPSIKRITIEEYNAIQKNNQNNEHEDNGNHYWQNKNGNNGQSQTTTGDLTPTIQLWNIQFIKNLQKEQKTLPEGLIKVKKYFLDVNSQDWVEINSLSILEGDQEIIVNNQENQVHVIRFKDVVRN